MRQTTALMAILFVAGTVLGQTQVPERIVIAGNPAARAAVAYHVESGLVVVARGAAAKIDLVDLHRGTTRSIASDLNHPTAVVIASDGQTALVVDAMENRAALVDIRAGTIRTVGLGETPVDALSAGRDMFVLCRDSSEIQRIRADGVVDALPVSPGSSLLRLSEGRLYVYNPQQGSVQEIAPDSMAVIRSGRTERFASDFEVDGSSGYLLFPRAGRMIVFSLDKLAETGRLNVGAVPVDLAIERDPSRLTAGSVAVADPSSKKIWRTERSQSFGEAFARGFARGLLGLGLFAPKSSEYPRGIDRIQIGGGSLAALDSSSGNLYTTRGGRSILVAKGMTAVSFDLGSDGDLVVVTDSGVRRISKRSLGTGTPQPAKTRPR